LANTANLYHSRLKTAGRTKLDSTCVYHFRDPDYFVVAQFDARKPYCHRSLRGRPGNSGWHDGRRSGFGFVARRWSEDSLSIRSFFPTTRMAHGGRTDRKVPK